MDDVEAQAPTVGWAAGPLRAVQAADREIARQTAIRARAVAEFAATRPASADRPPGRPGSMSPDRRAARAAAMADVSEWAAQELVVALSISQKAADELLTRSLTLVHRLPRTLDALESGVLHAGHLWSLLDKVAPVADPRVRAVLERDLLRWMRRREVTTPAQLSDKIARELLARDLRAAARDLESALRRRGVFARPDRTDGMAVLSALMTVPEADAVLDALGRYADALDDEGPPRSRGQKMLDCLMDLVLRPGENDLAPVQARLTVVAPVATMVGGEQPGEIGGQPVPAEMVRALARALGLLPDVPAPDDAPDVSLAPGTHHQEDDVLDEAQQRALEIWWADVEARALDGDWRGEDEPPLDELERWWALEARWSTPGPPPGPEPEGEEEPSPGWWTAADQAVEEAGATLLDLERQLGRARSAVRMAESADQADEEEWQQSSAGRPGPAADALAALARVTEERRAQLGHLLESTGGGGLVDRPRIAVTDALTGVLLALSDARGLREAGTCGRSRCRRGAVACTHDLRDRPGLGPPGPSSTYRPGVALDRFLRARDRRCRFPGCRRRVPLGGELDHHLSWPDGPTAAGNLTGFCTGHHRGKHQAPGWSYDMSPDGVLTVSTPTGVAASTCPPPY
ncbi:HNH endonuclease signature motif containing protein [Blastococcus sp. PRF04-17]|uniref:HNH endonuclease signature motif containing protein n=1 Tax=Blastococcus sp. PRF04-17 TaxID=2933797 RepID=UPI001FF11F77|nr:HNH endonuclease signature motif containing protein [Blastococcus sp. PRF04-17]UOY01452.1 HNH endonuclease [Blastococcus sp. PRF04-17]